MSGDAGDQHRRVSTDGSSDGGIDIPDWEVLNRDLATVELPIRSVPQMPPKVCDFWLQFPRFVPNPTASFVEEFDSLARHMAWSAKNRRKNLVKALAAEIDFHCDGSSGLIRWQRLCQEVGVGSKPASITQCKQVLKSFSVNLYNVLDHRRNPDIPVVCFKSFKELIQDIHRTGTFPRQCAKRDRYIKVLLRKM